MECLKVVFLFLCVSGVLSMPDGWGSCKQSSPDFQDCLKKQINNSIKYLKHGDKKMGIIPLDPLVFETMDVEQGSGPVSVILKMKNFKLDGLSTSQVLSVENNAWKTMKIKFHIPFVHTEGDYTINGQILVLPMSGSGKATLDWKELDYTFDITFKKITKDGKTYFQVDKMPVTLQPKGVAFNFDNLFNGNKELGTNTNKFLNEHWEEILNELKPALSRTLEKGYKEYINRVLSMIPADQIDVK